MFNVFSLGASVTVDPKTRTVTHIDGAPIDEDIALEHADALEAFAEAALADFGPE